MPMETTLDGGDEPWLFKKGCVPVRAYAVGGTSLLGVKSQILPRSRKAYDVIGRLSAPAGKGEGALDRKKGPVMLGKRDSSADAL